MTLIALSFSYKSAPVEFRERLAFGPDTLQAIHSDPAALGLKEVVVVSTCNRVEIYGTSRDLEQTIEHIYSYLQSATQLELQSLESCAQLFTGADAVNHLFRVSSSLESMVLGEPQVLGQVKDAYRAARELQKLPQLEKLFIRAFKAAKRVRTETGIAQNAVSVSFAAVELARKIFEKLDEKQCMLIGAGEMCELAARHLASHGVRNFIVANRTLERAQRLATMFSGTACTLDKLEDYLHTCDIVICSTGAQEPVITKDMARRAIKKRGMENPMFFIDIAVPRDVEESVNDVPMAYRYDIDDLQEVVEENKRTRIHEKEKALGIIEHETAQYLQWLEVRDISQYIVAFRANAEGILANELEQSASKLSAEMRQEMERFGRRLMNKFLHAPSTNIKRLLSDDENSALYVETFKKLFDLERS
ncbi:glutamyl-tRNA reductase [Desulfurispirillum indicum]|uniref:Glutamyl-tRNA reductase n=1 Tax=Desulfurispirillum indicum (strain ATCC BAA-1389 / DSM 22839 / S5) TaxID=653733 RepID=E6W4I2_DESIS|nr:glutamyl-tRNA reductase [Desulfurispirillum indicum]ADU67055.1 glutamyl-tRNA reductase [Desulfurispirillum indicum S5]UCZ56286.1 glutamyl-tRNA reductase [Desulfurispirillum indicum]